MPCPLVRICQTGVERYVALVIPSPASPQRLSSAGLF